MWNGIIHYGNIYILKIEESNDLYIVYLSNQKLNKLKYCIKQLESELMIPSSLAEAYKNHIISSDNLNSFKNVRNNKM